MGLSDRDQSVEKWIKLYLARQRIRQKLEYSTKALKDKSFSNSKLPKKSRKKNIYHVFDKFLFSFYRYSFAIVGINLTHMAYRFLIDSSAKTHMFNVCASSPVESERRPILKVIRERNFWLNLIFFKDIFTLGVVMEFDKIHFV